MESIQLKNNNESVGKKGGKELRPVNQFQHLSSNICAHITHSTITEDVARLPCTITLQDNLPFVQLNLRTYSHLIKPNLQLNLHSGTYITQSSLQARC